MAVALMVSGVPPRSVDLRRATLMWASKKSNN